MVRTTNHDTAIRVAITTRAVMMVAERARRTLDSLRAMPALNWRWAVSFSLATSLLSVVSADCMRATVAPGSPCSSSSMIFAADAAGA